VARAKLSPDATNDLSNIVSYTSQQSGEKGASLVRVRIISLMDVLAAYPNAGRGSRVGGRNALRFSVSPWLVYYEPATAGDGIYVLRILDGRRDLSDIL
jgi:plasmid stabilization system protein ParE